MTLPMPPSPVDIDAACKAAAESAGGPWDVWSEWQREKYREQIRAAIAALVSRGWSDPKQTTQRLRDLAAAREALRPLAEFADQLERNHPSWYYANGIEFTAPLKLFTDARRAFKEGSK